VSGEPVVGPRHGVGRDCLKDPDEGPSEEHHFSQDAAPWSKHEAIFFFALGVPTLSHGAVGPSSRGYAIIGWM
jgi:hypothetical protein